MRLSLLRPWRLTMRQVYTCVCICVCMCMRVCTYVCCICVCVLCKYAYIRVCRCVHIHVYAYYMYIHIYTYTYVYIWSNTLERHQFVHTLFLLSVFPHHQIAAPHSTHTHTPTNRKDEATKGCNSLSFSSSLSFYLFFSFSCTLCFNFIRQHPCPPPTHTRRQTKKNTTTQECHTRT